MTERPGHARELAARAVGAGVDVAVVAGGDGTVNEVAGALVGSDTALAVLPAGTGNVLAAQLGLIPVPTPLHRGNLPAAAQQLVRGRVRGVDVGLARAGGRERHFLLWAGVGLDASVTYELEQEHRALKRMLGAAAFGAIGIKAALSSEAHEALLRGDDWRVRAPLLMAVAANIPLYGGAIAIAPEARIDDGALDVVLFTGEGVVATMRHVKSMLTRRLKGDAIRTHRTRTLCVTSSLPFRVHVDAEPFGETPLTVTTLPRALRLLVPPTAPESLFADPAGGGA
jgi:YegS/Rv2252/BmrU family lipid kinase